MILANIKNIFEVFYMPLNNPHSVDRSYKFNYKRLNIKFHRYFYNEGEKIEFIETEVPETGQRKDMVVKVDDKKIQITEFMSKTLYDEKLRDLYDYHESTRHDINHKDLAVKTDVISIANPHHGKNNVEIDENIIFQVNPKFISEKDGWKVLNTLIYKTITQEELSDKEAIDLLILPDMNINFPIKQLMKIICFLIAHANISDEDFRTDIIVCEIMVLARFFREDELSEMIKMLQTQTKNSEVERIIKKYGRGFDVYYFDGKADGFKEGISEGFKDGKSDGKREVAINFLKDGFDEEVISRNTGIPIDEIKELKRKL